MNSTISKSYFVLALPPISHGLDSASKSVLRAEHKTLMGELQRRLARNKFPNEASAKHSLAVLVRAGLPADRFFVTEQMDVFF